MTMPDEDKIKHDCNPWDNSCGSCTCYQFQLEQYCEKIDRILKKAECTCVIDLKTDEETKCVKCLIEDKNEKA